MVEAMTMRAHRLVVLALLTLTGACRTQMPWGNLSGDDTAADQPGPVCDLGSSTTSERPVMVLVNGRKVTLLGANGARRDVVELLIGDTEQGVTTIVTSRERAGVRLWGGLGQLATGVMIDTSGRVVWRDDRNLPTRSPWFLEESGVSILPEVTVDAGRVRAVTQVIPVEGNAEVIREVQALGLPVRGHVPAVEWHETTDENGDAYIHRVGWLRLLSGRTQPLGAAVLHSSHNVVTAVGERVYYLADRQGAAALTEITLDGSREIAIDYTGDAHALVFGEAVGGRWFTITVHRQRSPFWRVDASNGSVTRIELNAPAGKALVDGADVALTEDGQVTTTLVESGRAGVYRSADGRTDWALVGHAFATPRALRVYDHEGSALLTDGAGHLQVVREGSSHDLTASPDTRVEGVRWSRDGRCVAWVEHAGERHAVRAMDLTTGNRRTLQNDARPNVAVAWW